MFNEWEGFIQGKWCESINVREFINKNYTPYMGGDDFLEGATEKTEKTGDGSMSLCR